MFLINKETKILIIDFCQGYDLQINKFFIALKKTVVSKIGKNSFKNDYSLEGMIYRDGNPNPTDFLDPERIRIRIRILNLNYGFGLLIF